jgi:hypothetical protein
LDDGPTGALSLSDKVRDQKPARHRLQKNSATITFHQEKRNRRNKIILGRENPFLACFQIPSEWASAYKIAKAVTL